MAINESIEKFQKLKYPVHNVSGNLLEKFPDLTRYKAFRDYKMADNNKFIKYIVYLYDPASELHTEYADVQEIKEAAAKEAGFKKIADGSWDNEKLNNIMAGDYNHEHASKIFEMIMCYITRIVNRVKWTQYCSTLTQYENINRLLMGKLDFTSDKEKVSSYRNFKDLNKLSEELADRLQVLQQELFAGDEEVANETVKRTPILTPEYIASLELIPR